MAFTQLRESFESVVICPHRYEIRVLESELSGDIFTRTQCTRGLEYQHKL